MLKICTVFIICEPLNNVNFLFGFIYFFITKRTFKCQIES